VYLISLNCGKMHWLLSFTVLGNNLKKPQMPNLPQPQKNPTLPKILLYPGPHIRFNRLIPGL
jgi:hypothetical protein